MATDEEDLTLISIETQTSKSFYSLTMDARGITKDSTKDIVLRRSRNFIPDLT